MSERLTIGQRVRIETWGTVKDIADSHGSSYGVALDQRGYAPELDHFRFAWFDADEIRRAADLSDEDREALSGLRTLVQEAERAAEAGVHVDASRLLAVLDRLAKGAE